MTMGEWRLEKLVISGLPLSVNTLSTLFKYVSALPDEQKRRFRKLKLGSIPNVSIGIPGFDDTLMAVLLSSFQALSLESISLFHNFGLGKRVEPMKTFIETVGRRCRVRIAFLSFKSLITLTDLKLNQ